MRATHVVWCRVRLRFVCPRLVRLCGVCALTVLSSDHSGTPSYDQGAQSQNLRSHVSLLEPVSVERQHTCQNLNTG